MEKLSKLSRLSFRRVLFVSLAIFGLCVFTIMGVFSTTISYKQTSYSSLTPHSAIIITSDINFTDYGFLGSGTVENPYLIEGYNITTTSYRGISITGTTKYFIVRNCYVDANSGINIDDVADGTATVINNMCNNINDRGIWLRDSNSSTVINNTCNNGEWGIFLQSSVSSTVANNTCNNNMFGIWLYNSDSSNVINNTCNNNRLEGILLGLSENSTVVNNTFTNCSLHIAESSVDAYLSYSVENNWVNGKKLGFYTNLESTTIAEPVYGQLILVNCTNVTVRDQIINYATVGLFLYSCVSSVIINNTCNNIDGIRLYYSDYSTVVNNTCSNNIVGIKLYSSGSSTVANNIYNNNTFEGIFLSNSDSSMVANNTCNNNDYSGIYLSNSSSSTVINNTCINNKVYGIKLGYSVSSTAESNTCNNNKYGIALTSSNSSTVTKNMCNNNNRWGILLDSSDCVVIYNILQENEKYGVYSSSISDNILIHHNTFVDNNLGGTSQAFDEGTNNFWYDTTTLEGNYWSDWSGTGSYAIDGSVGSEDLYPLDEPVEFSTDETQIFFTFTLLMLVVPLIFTVVISRKRLRIA